MLIGTLVFMLYNNSVGRDEDLAVASAGKHDGDKLILQGKEHDGDMGSVAHRVVYRADADEAVVNLSSGEAGDGGPEILNCREVGGHQWCRYL